MENVNPQSLEEIVSHQKKKQKRLLAIIASIAGGLLVIAAIGGFIWYNSGNISGNWRNADVEQTILTDSGLTADTLFSGLEIDSSESLADVRYALEVSGNKASLVGSVTFNKELFLQAYAKLIDSEYQKILAELSSQATTVGLSTEEYLSQALGNDYETALKSSFPSNDEIISELDSQLASFATSNGFEYNATTGELSTTILEGEVNQLLHSMTITSINTAALAEFTEEDITTGDVIVYNRTGDKLTFLGDNSVFTLEK